MTATVDILSILTVRAEDYARRFGVRRLGVFGSFARGEAGPDSDIDVLVELETPSFDSYMDLMFELEDLFGRRVDLVLVEALKPALRDRVLSEVRYVA